jgi:hypothetical protein
MPSQRLVVVDREQAKEVLDFDQLPDECGGSISVVLPE